MTPAVKSVLVVVKFDGSSAALCDWAADPSYGSFAGVPRGAGECIEECSIVSGSCMASDSVYIFAEISRCVSGDVVGC